MTTQDAIEYLRAVQFDGCGILACPELAEAIGLLLTDRDRLAAAHADDRRTIDALCEEGKLLTAALDTAAADRERQADGARLPSNEAILDVIEDSVWSADEKQRVRDAFDRPAGFWGRFVTRMAPLVRDLCARCYHEGFEEGIAQVSRPAGSDQCPRL